MVPSRPPNPINGSQSVAPSLLQSNSGLLGGAQPGAIPSQTPFSSLVSPRTQFNSSSLLGNISNVSSLLNQSIANGGLGPGANLAIPQMNFQSEPHSFTSSSNPTHAQQFQNPSSNQLGSENAQPQQLEAVQNLQQQFSMPHNQQPIRGGLANVKLEQQMGPSLTDQNGPTQPLRAVKLEPQQLQNKRNLGSVKMEPQSSDPSMLLQQQQQQNQQQQQQLMQLTRQNPQAAAAQMSLLQQQRLLQQQQILKSLPQQRSQLHQLQQQQQQQQQLHQQTLPLRSQGKGGAYEPGTCARRLTHYMYHQQRRPPDNNIDFWRSFVTEYFAPNAKKRWCVSLYGSGRQTTGVFPQDVWHCEICNHKPGRGFETTVEVLPRLFQIKYASGTLEELLYVDMPREYQNAAGQIVLDYQKAIQESVFEQLRVVRDGQLRIVFNPDLKIASWEFCARRHEELIPRRLIIPQKYQATVQNSSGPSSQDLQNSCNSFMASARQLAKALEVPLVNDLGYTKRYVRCLQIAEVVNSMKDLIDYSRQTRTGPMDSLINFPRRNSTSSGINPQQAQQPEEPQSVTQIPTLNAPNPAHSTSAQVPPASNGATSTNATNPVNCASSTATPPPTTVGVLQNSINSRQENQINSMNRPYPSGNNAQIPAPISSTSLASPQPNPTSSFPTAQVPSASNSNIMPSPRSADMSTMQPPPTQPREADPNDSQSSVQQILQELMMSTQSNGVSSLGNDMKRMNGITPGMNGGISTVGNVVPNNFAMGNVGFGSVGGIGPSPTAGGLRAAMANNAMAMNGRVGLNHISQDPIQMSHQPQQEMGSRLLSGLRTANSFNNLAYDWKPSP
ncbi:transcriptional corepressor SEUSS-like isoform X2 [Ananas comosus]|uniref:Transcriptional corepressor SEUSS-like isoform X2 n=1 Tax=Ananas comosus TaxID=4615 RepID=A0A6P5GEV2_ANACO|nr:transcriptional corepressor SEUSS-like isoform X2 [Ananas comosus]